jgi:hypothetical protein
VRAHWRCRTKPAGAAGRRARSRSRAPRAVEQSTSEYYKRAIVELAQYVASEPDASKATAALQKMMFYEHAIIDAAFDEMHRRTILLGNLATDLRAITERASRGPSIAGTLRKLNALQTEILPLLRP